MFGPPGIGKTHLAIALGRAAIEAGPSVLFITATALIAALSKAHAEGRLADLLSFYAKPKLRVIDPRARRRRRLGPAHRDLVPARRAPRPRPSVPRAATSSERAARRDHARRAAAARGRHRTPTRHRRYERGRILLTTNQPVTAWGRVFGDERIAAAVLDRLLHRSHTLVVSGDSYRLKQQRKTGLLGSSRKPSLPEHPGGFAFVS